MKNSFIVISAWFVVYSFNVPIDYALAVTLLSAALIADFIVFRIHNKRVDKIIGQLSLIHDELVITREAATVLAEAEKAKELEKEHERMKRIIENSINN